MLQAAVNTVPKDALKESQALKDLFEGVLLTQKNLQKTFRKHGLEPIAPELGEKFDPNFHEAMFEIPAQTPEQQQGTVGVVAKVGYALNARPIRAAQVGVIRKV